MMPKKQDRPLELVTYGPAEAAEAIGVGTTKMYELINDGTVPHVLIGGFIRVPLEALQRWAEQVAHPARCAPPRVRRPAKDTSTK
ncbi:MAG: helix-turn-helix domain-containing protein [Gammaproteobacteria bacterium]|nr:helix-turn-helix domain-containing protein [Gammaproteobacteria bacterium]